ncbi:hypothetical protein [Photobacterium leiognathi]|nr:hypothetical protein [Photobacterium leiognathi]
MKTNFKLISLYHDVATYSLGLLITGKHIPNAINIYEQRFKIIGNIIN